MLTRKAVFFVGAGASAEVGLPIGDSLKKQIAMMLTYDIEFGRRSSNNGDEVIYNTLLSEYGNEVNIYLAACGQIAKGLAHTYSIDDFIHNHQHNKVIAVCSKLAIAKAILDAEYSSKLYFDKRHIDDTINFGMVVDTWYPALYNLLTQGVTRDNLDKAFQNLTIVCFNYDRCIEHYLVNALIGHYSLDASVAITLVEKLTIHRPYGSVGNYFDRSNAFPYGSRHFPSIQAIASSLKTYTENTDTITERESMLDAINDAEMLVFLGMAYHPNNLELLYDSRNGTRKSLSHVYATRHKISDSNMPLIRRALNRISTPHASTDEKYSHVHTLESSQKCADLFTEYSMLMRS